jgi:hypothetical protein
MKKEGYGQMYQIEISLHPESGIVNKEIMEQAKTSIDSTS